MDEDKSLQSKVCQVILLTSCSEDLAAMTLHEFNNDVASTVDHILDTGGEKLQLVTGKKRNTKKSVLNQHIGATENDEDRSELNGSPIGAEHEQKVPSENRRAGNRHHRGRSTGGSRGRGAISAIGHDDADNLENSDANQTSRKPVRRTRSEKVKRSSAPFDTENQNITADKSELHSEFRGPRKSRGSGISKNRRPLNAEQDNSIENSYEQFNSTDPTIDDSRTLISNQTSRIVRFQNRGGRSRGRYHSDRGGGYRGYTRGGRVFTRRSHNDDKPRNDNSKDENGGSSGEHDGWDFNEGYELSTEQQTNDVTWKGEPLVFTNSSSTAQCVDQLIEEGPSLLSQYVPRPPGLDVNAHKMESNVEHSVIQKHDKAEWDVYNNWDVSVSNSSVGQLKHPEDMLSASRTLKEMIGVKSDINSLHNSNSHQLQSRSQPHFTLEDPEVLRKGIFSVPKRSKPPASSQRIPNKPVELPKGRLDYGSGFRFGDEGLSETVRNQMSLGTKEDDKNNHVPVSIPSSSCSFAHEATLHIQQQLGLVSPSPTSCHVDVGSKISTSIGETGEVPHYSQSQPTSNLHYHQSHVNVLHPNVSGSNPGYTSSSQSSYNMHSTNNRKVSPPQQLLSHSLQPTSVNSGTASSVPGVSAGSSTNPNISGIRPASNTSPAGGMESLSANVPAAQQAQSVMMHNIAFNSTPTPLMTSGNPTTHAYGATGNSPVSAISANQQLQASNLLYQGNAQTQQQPTGQMDYNSFLQTIALWSNINPQILQAVIQNTLPGNVSPNVGPSQTQGSNISGNPSIPLSSSAHHHSQQQSGMLLHPSASAQTQQQHNTPNSGAPLLMSQGSNSGAHGPVTLPQTGPNHNFVMNYLQGQVTSSQQRIVPNSYFSANSAPPQSSGGPYLVYPPSHQQGLAVMPQQQQPSNNVSLPANSVLADAVNSNQNSNAVSSQQSDNDVSGQQSHIPRDKFSSLKHGFNSPIKPQQQGGNNSANVNQAPHGGSSAGIFSSTSGPAMDFHHSSGYGSASNYPHHPGAGTGHPFMQATQYGVPQHFVHGDARMMATAGSNTNKMMNKNFSPWMSSASGSNPNSAGNAPGQTSTGNASNN